MKKTSLAAAAIVALPITAAAGNLTAPTVSPPPPEPVAQPDWSGFYAGAQASFDTGGVDFYNNNAFVVSRVFDPTTNYGAFAGYNIQNGALVYGGELAITTASGAVTGFPAAVFTSPAVDLKARIGYSMGSALVYGFAGGSSLSLDNAIGLIYDTVGLNYGIGASYLIGDNLFIGAEYLLRDMTGPRRDDPARTGNITTQSVEIRAGWQF